MAYTLEELKRQLPKRSKKLLNQEAVDVINSVEEQVGSEFSEVYRNNFITFSKVLENPDYTMTGYVEAVRFVSFRLMNYSIIDSYQLTFPHRYGRLLDKYSDHGDEEWIRSNKIAPYATIYSKGKLVNELLAQAAVPVSILNADLFQEALNVEAHLMKNARSETVKQLAAKTILEILKPEEIQKVELDIGLKENDVIKDLREVTMRLAEEQRLAIASGSVNSKYIAESTIIEAETEETKE